MNIPKTKTSTEREKPVISVVVPFYNAEKTLEICLEAIEKQSLNPEQIVLVDNKSEDNSLSIVGKFISDKKGKYKCYSKGKRGPSSARNKGIKESKGDVIAFVDADCIPDKKWIEQLSKEFEDPNVNVVAGKIKGIISSSLFDRFHSLFTLKSPEKTAVTKEFTLVRGGFPAANLALRKKVFEAIGGFDEKLIVGEDYDLCARIYKARFAINYVDRAIVHHMHRSSIKSTWSQSIGFGKAHAKLLRKHFTHLFILDLPGTTFVSKRLPILAWLNLSSADKKLIILGMTAAIWTPAVLILLLYLIWIVRIFRNRLKRENIHCKITDAALMAGLLIIKSAAFSTGRVIGSIKEKVVCI